ncbi:BatA domain-containing protein [Anditalea andensis]|uniref:Aerotolerance regulator N-terminal domain-containing protein n=1 Tax=Anditalea andensis TaxID=1048983 RepID=A0A074LMR0_9BACT|nr:BatA domain-containing protein [Anditalea andensis]KEO75167.1 hypothetical protein EL17_05725 [Anditalea andensis]
MGFLLPLLWWGAAAVSIPLLIHLWQKRRGKKIPWAAMRWLMDKEDQPKKGLKPDHLLLLFLRMAIILLVVFFLSQPYLKHNPDNDQRTNWHLVEVNPALVNEFRFELEQALANGEEIFWLNADLAPISSLDEVRHLEPHNAQALINGLNQVDRLKHKPHLYISPHSMYMDPPFLLTPAKPTIHFSEYAPLTTTGNYLQTGTSSFLHINKEGQLEAATTRPDNKIALDHSAPITYWIDFKNQQENDNVIAALQAISEIYTISFEASERPTEADMYFSYRIPSEVPSNQMIFISGYMDHDAHNVMISPDPFIKELSDIVASGRLPEYLLDHILRQKNLTISEKQVSRQQIERQFISTPTETIVQSGILNELIIVLLLIIIIAERVLALRKGI